MISLILSLFSLVVAITSFVLSVKKFKRDGFIQSYFANENHMMEIESRIGQYPNLLRFHGIDNPEKYLASIGINSCEFAYLVNSFTAGSLFFNTAEMALKEKILQRGSYRWTMCKTPAVKKAWPAIKILLAPGEYRDRLEVLVNE